MAANNNLNHYKKKLITQRSSVKITNQAKGKVLRPFRIGILAEQAHRSYVHNGRIVIF